MEFEDILVKVGEYGRYQQFFVYFFLVPAAFITPWLSMTTIFMVSSPNHVCTHYVDSRNYTDIQLDSLFASSNFTDNDKCFTSVNTSATSLTNKCDKWIFDKTNYHETFVTHNSLVCDNDHLVGTALAVISLGQLVGTPTLGYVADRFGRKIAYMIGITLSFISTLSPTLLKGVLPFILLRFVHGLATNACYQMPLVLAIEIMGPQGRTKMSLISSISFACGLATLPLAAYLTAHWYYMSLISTVVVSFALVMSRLIPESPRWLISVQRYGKAYSILSKVAKTNGIQVDERLILDIREVGRKFESNSKTETNEVKVLCSQFFNRSILFILALNALSLLASEVAYTGLHYNIRNFKGNEFLNYFLLVSVEPIASIIGCLLMDSRLGRRWTLSLCLAWAGISLTICSMIDPSDLVRVALFSMMGKMGATIGYIVSSLHGSEMLPTVIRNQGLSVSYFVLSAGSIFIPYIIHLGKYGSNIPLICMGIIDLTAAAFSTLLPETQNRVLPQTVEESEKLVQSRKYWSLAPKSPPRKVHVEQGETVGII
ncbi:organic cation transporter 1 [Tetranychus urticae]|uniref:Major facilitator superfamily (MFS) profile domain-containing protein n=1 Tax=Tetranychus urticae TaxID=32264 RepID=T1L022_TETUR|nr:organic cation transporter 1 [Tetranychus urticae]